MSPPLRQAAQGGSFNSEVTTRIGFRVSGRACKSLSRLFESDSELKAFSLLQSTDVHGCCLMSTCLGDLWGAPPKVLTRSAEDKMRETPNTERVLIQG